MIKSHFGLVSENRVQTFNVSIESTCIRLVCQNRSYNIYTAYARVRLYALANEIHNMNIEEICICHVCMTMAIDNLNAW